MMKKHSFFLLFLATIFLASCKKNPPQVGLGEEFTLKYNKSVLISDSNTGKSFKLKFNDVEDSRCPVDVNCIWAGEVTVELKIDNKDKLKVNLGEAKEYGQYKIMLLEVAPENSYQNSKSKKKYSAKLKVI